MGVLYVDTGGRGVSHRGPPKGSMQRPRWGEDPEEGQELPPRGPAWPALRGPLGGEVRQRQGAPGLVRCPHLGVRSRWRWCRREEEKLGAGPRARRRSFVSLQR